MGRDLSPDEIQEELSRAVIVGVSLNGDDHDNMDDGLDELEALLSTLEIRTVGRVIQRRQKFTAKSLLGTGKVEEIRQLAETYSAGLIVFDNPLAPPQVRNIEKMTDREVIDRTGVILEIFSRHARTNQAKLQVEIARLEYLLPRLTGAWTHFQRQTGGGVKARGMGEKQIEVDRRRAREKISRMQKQLEHIGKEKQLQRKSRFSELKVALVGYTNSGKTTLMKNLTKSNIEAHDKLFATLDTNIKIIDPRTRPKILLSDTVGFIRNLPHSLVESFKSTLEEVAEADLLLEVVDVSHSCYREHIKTTRKVLEEIGAGEIPSVVVFNKVDLVEDQILPRVLPAAYPKSIVLSANDEKDVDRLRDHIFAFFKANFVKETIVVPADDNAIISLIHNTSVIIDTDYSEHGRITFSIQAATSTINKLKSMLNSNSEERSS